jgi:CubicO group peptidase (beta-lactamase class C family)
VIQIDLSFFSAAIYGRGRWIVNPITENILKPQATNTSVMRQTPGLLLAHDGTILHESYIQGCDQSSFITRSSMAKSFAPVLVGLVIEKGTIDSVHDSITARGGAEDGVPIHHILTMSSGVAFDQEYESFFSGIVWLPIRIFGFGEPIDNRFFERA